LNITFKQYKHQPPIHEPFDQLHTV